jgi:hypothetical protein
MNARETELFVRRFESHQLTEREWTHEAHILVLLWHLREEGLDYALCKLRPGIITFNAALGGQNSPTGGYHETLTLFWAMMGHRFVAQASAGNWEELWAEAQKSPLMDKRLPWQYYSEEQLFSTTARARWVAPDRKEWELV